MLLCVVWVSWLGFLLSGLPLESVPVLFEMEVVS
jgi:hypothetical protein